ncbi:multiple inositol polyphosphate phosphatase 1-like [Pholidichthys leucotaenia]
MGCNSRQASNSRHNTVSVAAAFLSSGQPSHASPLGLSAPLDNRIMPILLRAVVFIHLITVSNLFGLISCSINNVNPNDDPNIPAIAKYLSTKGRYEEVNPYLRKDILAVNRSVLQPPSKRCREIHLTAIIRHGTRFPTAKNVRKMQKLYDLVFRSSDAAGKRWLRDIQTRWRMWYTEDMDGQLVQKGADDHKNLAVRLSKLFPSLISEANLRGGFIKFITSSKHRCVNSTLSFKAGLTELWDIKDMEVEHAENDALMRFFDNCKRYVNEVDDNPSALPELDKFKQGPEMRRVQQKIADRINVPYSFITDDMAEAALFMCAYEFAIKTVNSPWCQLLDEVDAQVLEYASDLKQFWKRSYGYDINSKSSCILFHDMFSRLNRSVRERQLDQQVSEAVTVQVGHAETLLPLLTLLGFFKDSVPLTSTNYATQTNRIFRTSLMMPYAANLLFVLYDCGGGDMRLQPLLNEKPVTFPGLADQPNSIPLYQDVLNRYRDLLSGCDFETECQLFEQNKVLFEL